MKKQMQARQGKHDLQAIALAADNTVAKRGRRINLADVQAIAELVAMRLTEKEACIHLGINPESWSQWKIRHNGVTGFETILTRVRTAKLRGLIDGIRQAGFGENGQRADWRALDRLLTITAPERYSERLAALPGPETDALADSLLAKMLSKAYASQPAPAARLPESTEVTDVVLVSEPKGE